MSNEKLKKSVVFSWVELLNEETDESTTGKQVSNDDQPESQKSRDSCGENSQHTS